MWNRKELKRKSKKILKKNFINRVFVCLIILILVGGYGFTKTSLLDGQDLLSKKIPILNKFYVNNNSATNLSEKTGTTGGTFKVIFDATSNIASSTKVYLVNAEKIVTTVIDNKSLLKLLSIIGATIISLLFKILVLNVLDVGERRFFLESRKYTKTKITRILSNFKDKKYWKTVKTELLRNLYLTLWTFTIIGGIIKSYSYRMVKYILAENPNIKSNEVITLSKKMMKGNKWKLFILDISYILYYILNGLTFGLLGVFFLDPYIRTTETELYIILRDNIKKDPAIAKLLNDKNLDIENDSDYYPGTKKEEKQLDYYRKYTLTSFILFFFSFAIVGWLWEVVLYIFKDGKFINRGTMHGPWLPVYGFGCIAVLLLLIPKKFKKLTDNPLLTFLTVIAICSTIEYCSAWYCETFKCARWWDYSGYFLNIQGRVCLECSLFFGIGGIICIYFIAPTLDKFYHKLSKKTTMIICILLISLYSIDFIYSSNHPNMGAGITEINNPSSKPIKSKYCGNIKK